MGGQGKGGARASFLPPARSRAPPPGSDGPTITEKIKARKEGGAEEWDQFKARIAKQQQEAHAIENHEVLMSAQHREMLDKERDARLARAPVQSKSERKRKDASDSSSDSDDSDGSPSRKRRKKDHRKEKKRKHDRHDKHKHKHKHDSHKHKKHKHKKKSHRHSGSSSSSDGEPKKAKEPVALSAFLAAQSDSDD